MSTNLAFHSQDGLYFTRMEDGSVKVTVKERDEVKFETALPASIWGSVVSSVSLKGETYETWQQAQAFHNDSSVNNFR
jgi:hypothetical protein